ncbi:MAG TPA: DegQ family serine endoprotease [Candidatus Dormibacteraeota bacterium]|nr:DegQ family serine endoprotease [Candidatus Dormibacteraeota bacterium]
MSVPGSTGRKGAYGWVLLIGVALVAGGLVRAGIIRVPGHDVLGANKVILKIAKDTTPIALGNFKNGFSSVIDPVLPAVVNISSTKIVKQQQMQGFADPFFRQFFGNQFPSPQTPQTEREYSLGSGVIVNPDGYILTNNHVVAGASDVEVFTQDRKKYKAKIIGTDPRTDIAVLKIDATGLPILTLGDSSKLKVGDLVFAIGDPFGIGETATTGIVSAIGRGLGGAIERYENFIQTDAAINPGNSGGALIDLHGNLIGINTAIISGGGGGNQGIGFAIPINMARNVMDQIVDHGKVIRGFLGVTIQAVNPDMAKAFGLAQGGGALVGDVEPNSPASKAGVQRGDVILELNGQKVNGPDDLSVRIAELAPGTVAHLKVFRNGQSRNIDVTLGENTGKGQGLQGSEAAAAALKGVQVQNLTRALAQQLGLPASSTGVVVTEVDSSSAAAAAGIQQGDVIEEVNRKPVRNVNQYEQAIAGAGNQPVLLLVSRGGVTHFIVVAPQ